MQKRTTERPPELIRAIRRYAREHSTSTRHDNPPVKILPDSGQEPALSGNVGHYETAGGTWINHPAAYGKKGWNNMRYIRSSRGITVGDRWAEQHYGELWGKYVAHLVAKALTGN